MLETLLPPQTYFTIGEVSRLTQVKPYVIRYWETQFGVLRPPRRDSGQHDKRFTIAGAKRILQQESRRGVAVPFKLPVAEVENESNVPDSLRSIRTDLEEALRLLKGY